MTNFNKLTNAQHDAVLKIDGAFCEAVKHGTFRKYAEIAIGCENTTTVDKDISFIEEKGLNQGKALILSDIRKCTLKSLVKHGYIDEFYNISKYYTIVIISLAYFDKLSSVYNGVELYGDEQPLPFDSVVMKEHEIYEVVQPLFENNLSRNQNLILKWLLEEVVTAIDIGDNRKYFDNVSGNQRALFKRLMSNHLMDNPGKFIVIPKIIPLDGDALCEDGYIDSFECFGDYTFVVLNEGFYIYMRDLLDIVNLLQDGSKQVRAAKSVGSYIEYLLFDDRATPYNYHKLRDGKVLIPWNLRVIEDLRHIGVLTSLIEFEYGCKTCWVNLTSDYIERQNDGTAFPINYQLMRKAYEARNYPNFIYNNGIHNFWEFSLLRKFECSLRISDSAVWQLVDAGIIDAESVIELPEGYVFRFTREFIYLRSDEQIQEVCRASNDIEHGYRSCMDCKSMEDVILKIPESAAHEAKNFLQFKFRDIPFDAEIFCVTTAYGNDLEIMYQSGCILDYIEIVEGVYLLKIHPFYKDYLDLKIGIKG